MTQKTITAVNALFVAAFLFITQGINALHFALTDGPGIAKDHVKTYHPITATVEEIPEPEEIKPSPVFAEQAALRKIWDGVTVTYRAMELEYLGRFFITAYCPEECGWNWETSSGATCHYSEEWATPTTCAIDLNTLGYWETIQVGDPDDPDKKVYITEDTGPGVRGRWVDCFVETMDEVNAWPTRWDSVYRVEYVTEEIIPSERKTRNEFISFYLRARSAGPGLYCGHDPGVDN